MTEPLLPPESPVALAPAAAAGRRLANAPGFPVGLVVRVRSARALRRLEKDYPGTQPR